MSGPSETVRLVPPWPYHFSLLKIVLLVNAEHYGRAGANPRVLE